MACYFHPDRQSVAQCVACKIELCPECRHEANARTYCYAHVPAAAAAPPTAPAPAPGPAAGGPTPAGPTPGPAAPGTPGLSLPQQIPATAQVTDPAYNPTFGLLALLLGWIGGLIALCTDAKACRDNRYMAWYGIFFDIALVVVFFVLGILWFAVAFIPYVRGLLFLAGPVWGLVSLASVVVKILNAVKAYNRQMPISLPVVADLAAKQADKG
jgi:uncharacterized membrane protein